MADNDISYKKIKRNAQKNKIADFTINSAPELRNDQKLPKNGSLNCDLLKFFIGVVYLEATW